MELETRASLPANLLRSALSFHGMLMDCHCLSLREQGLRILAQCGMLPENWEDFGRFAEYVFMSPALYQWNNHAYAIPRLRQHALTSPVFLGSYGSELDHLLFFIRFYQNGRVLL